MCLFAFVLMCFCKKTYVLLRAILRMFVGVLVSLGQEDSKV